MGRKRGRERREGGEHGEKGRGGEPDLEEEEGRGASGVESLSRRERATGWVDEWVEDERLDRPSSPRPSARGLLREGDDS